MKALIGGEVERITSGEVVKRETDHRTGDRSNARVQVWDNDLNFKAIYDQVGSPWAVCISPGPHQYLFVSNSVPDNGDSRAAAQTGEIYKMELDGKVLGRFGKASKIDLP